MERQPYGAPSAMDALLDTYVSRFQNMEPFDIYTIDSQGVPTAIGGRHVTGPEIVAQLVWHDAEDAVQSRLVAGQILEWGRLAAQANRIWQIEERRYRTWKAQQFLEGIEAAEKVGQKKPSDKILEANYRTHEDYTAVKSRCERAEEAWAATDMIVNAFRAKERMLSRR